MGAGCRRASRGDAGGHRGRYPRRSSDRPHSHLSRVAPYLERTSFQPWDARCIRVRAWLLEQAGLHAEEVEEHILRTLDAYFDCVARTLLASARAVGKRTMGNEQSVIRGIWGVADIEELKNRWIDGELGRGPLRAFGAPWSRESQPQEEPARSGRPSARRPRF